MKKVLKPRARIGGDLIAYLFMATIPLCSAHCISTTICPVNCVRAGIKVYSHCADCVAKGDNYI